MKITKFLDKSDMKAYKVLLVGVCAVSLLLTLLIGCDGGGGGSEAESEGGGITSTHPTANPNALPRAKALLNYFYSLKDLNTINPNSNKSIISGECADGVGTDPRGVNLQTLHDQTGKWVVLTSVPYYNYYNQAVTPVDYSRANPFLINWWNNGGLVQVQSNFRSPCPGTTYSNLGDMTCTSAQYTAIYTPGTPQNNLFNAELDAFAAGFQQLSDAGVVVIFSPFEEINGSWSWFSRTDSAGVKFKALWQYTFNYMTTTKHLNNILWQYEVVPNGMDPVALYPGDAYVDIVGISAYPALPGLPTASITARYNSLIPLGKPFIFSQFGTAVTESPDNTYDNMNLLNSIKTYYPLTIMWQNWLGGWSIEHQKNASTLLNDPRVINRGDIKF